MVFAWMAAVCGVVAAAGYIWYLVPAVVLAAAAAQILVPDDDEHPGET